MTPARKSFLTFLLAAAWLAPGVFPASAQPPEFSLSRPAAPLSPQTRPLSAVVTDNLTGLAYEDSEKQELLKLQAREFMAFKATRLTVAARGALIKACSADQGENPFCEEILASLPAARGPASRRRKRRPSHGSLTAELVAGRTPALSSASEGDVIGALKKIPDIKKLDKLLKSLRAMKTCPSPALTTALGFKAEERFPGEDYLKLAEEMYLSSAKCGDDDSSVKARYRLGLIYVWQNRCSEADTLLAKISDRDDAPDYKSRVVYWRLHCARQAKNDKLYEQMKERLLRDHPLSLHSLFVNGDLADLAIVNPREPDVMFRSVKKPRANGAVRAAEAMLAIDNKEYAMDLLEPLSDGRGDELKGAEPTFSLYVAVLLNRAGDTIRKFQMLASIFREQPGFISRLTMEMLYPLKRFDVINLHKSKVNPYLIISLIRQESAFNDHARSPAGAMGLMQLMPGTARRIESVSRRELLDPKTNIRLGVKYVARLLGRYDGDAEYALAAYNAGPDKVDGWRRRYPVENRLLFLDLIPFRETREYVAAIARNYYWYLRLYNRAPAVAAGIAIPAYSAGSGDPRPSRSPAGFGLFSF